MNGSPVIKVDNNAVALAVCAGNEVLEQMQKLKQLDVDGPMERTDIMKIDKCVQ